MSAPKPSSLEGKGRRPETPYTRIIWAAQRGHGCTLSFEECREMQFDDALVQVALQETGVVDYGGEILPPRYSQK